MPTDPRVLGAEVFRGEAIIVSFSDGTAAVVTVDDLLSFAPVRYQAHEESNEPAAGQQVQPDRSGK